MASFGEHFSFADVHRSSFELSPEHDASLFIDLDSIIPWLSERFKPEDHAPQVVINGDFGTGKTHVLRFIEKKLGPDKGMRTVYFELDGFGRKSTFFDLHIRVMSGLCDILESNLSRYKNLHKFLTKAETSGLLSSEMARAVRLLSDSSQTAETRALLRAWLIGTGPTPTQARTKLALSGRLFERAGPAALVNLWKMVSELEYDTNGRSLVVLLDEGESFGRIVSPDSQAAMGSGLRTLFDASNRSMGIALGLNTPQSREGLHPMLRSDVRGRLTGKEFLLNPLNTPDRIRRFIVALWERLRSKTAASALLDPEALTLLCQRLVALRDAISLHQRVLSSTPTQRDLMRVLGFIGDRAFAEGVKLPLTRDLLLRWFQVSLV